MSEATTNPFAKRCYTMSEQHLSGYRLIVGFDRLEDAQDAHTFVANVGRAALSQPAPLAGEVTDEQREKVMDAIAEALGDAYDCTRVWEAWSVGTMSQDDFSVVRDDQSRLAEIADAAILALRPQTQTGEWQSVSEDDLTAFEKFITDRSHNAPFIPADASTLANATMHMIREVRATRSKRPQAVPMTWPKARDVGRYGDMSPGQHLRVGLDSDNDVYVSVWDDEGGASVEFCNPGGGGGGSSRRTREALIALMVAIEEDNAERPEKDWWARRNGITAKAKGVKP